MGRKVYDAALSAEGLDIFIHNLENSADGKAVLIVNPTGADYSVIIPSNAEQYMLTADDWKQKQYN